METFVPCDTYSTALRFFPKVWNGRTEGESPNLCDSGVSSFATSSDNEDGSEYFHV